MKRKWNVQCVRIDDVNREDTNDNSDSENDEYDPFDLCIRVLYSF